MINFDIDVKDNLIHSITNPISINLCANGVLAVGAKPIMAEHPKEVGQVTKNAKALAVNIGNITDARMESIMIASKVARDNNIPCVIDVVGVSCIDFRKEYAIKYINEIKPTVIKGNVSEILALLGKESTSGIDAKTIVDENNLEEIAVDIEKFSKLSGAIVVATSKVDIITNGQDTYYIDNGSSMMPYVTGTGCLLNCLIGTYLSGTKDYLNACVVATAKLNICGELSETEKGTGDFQVTLINNLSTISNTALKEKIKLKWRKL